MTACLHQEARKISTKADGSESVMRLDRDRREGSNHENKLTVSIRKFKSLPDVMGKSGNIVGLYMHGFEKYTA